MRIRGKLENYESVDQLLHDLVANIPEGEVTRKVDAKTIFKDLKEKVLREEVLTHGVRLDGRAFDEVRPIWIETSVLPRTRSSSDVGCSPGRVDTCRQVAEPGKTPPPRAGRRPARRADDLPLPDAPTSARKLVPTRRAMSSATRRSRPK